MAAQSPKIERVLFIAPQMEPRGTSEYTVNLAKEFKRRGVEVAVFCVPGLMLDALRTEQIPVTIFDHLESKWFRFTQAKSLLAAAERFSPQVVHGQTVRVSRPLRSLARYASLAADEQPSAPIVLTVHWPPRARTAFRSLADRTLSGIIATTQDVREGLVNAFGVDKAKIAVVPNGIDVDASAASSRKMRPIFSGFRPVVGSVGPVETARGHELFVQAVARLVRAGKLLQFVVAGEGDELPQLCRLASRLGLDKHLTFVRDFASYDEILSALDIVVQSSQVDVSGFSILEAMAHGRPVIAFNTGTACEMLETGKTGILVRRGDVDGLAQAIEDLAENTERAREIGQAARTKVAENFNIKDVADMTLAFYARLCAVGGPDGLSPKAL
jgi:glycosyltransferase involved in cell wall biosynthesis